MIPQTIVCQAPLSMEFSKQKHWTGLPFLSSGALPNPGIKPWSPALQAGSLPSEPPGKIDLTCKCCKFRKVAFHCHSIIKEKIQYLVN